ncbi:DoxX family protein [Brevibacillus nitrificans]|uniref:DoxX family protein n=1 Tax=Brevibacillus nitrificans TaxID=651560 RepID=UPI0026110D1A|nr:DoxX family protein [Brevibacillus nitrificans]MED1791377.1 DoxX family protein [Brevibacillus nitrificans]
MTTLSIIIQSLLILIFLLAGGSKLVGAKVQVEAFNHLGLPQWFRVVTGLVQYIGVTGLIIGFWHPWVTAWAGVWLGITMFFGCIAHLKVKDPVSKTMPAFVLGVLAIVLVLIHAEGIRYPFS